jgi:hypothetical protein
MTTTSPWSRDATESLPPQRPITGPPAISAPPPFTGRRPGRRQWPWITAAVLATVAAGGTGSAITYAVTHTEVTAPPAAAVPQAPTITAAEAAAAKDHLCHVVDITTGSPAEGAFREQGNLNMFVTVKAINSVIAVQDALTPAVPADIAAAARKYISATVDVTTAALSTTPIDELRHLNDVDNDAMYALLDACGLPR